MNTKVMFSSETPEWETPQNLFDGLDEDFNFDLDVCANKENKKCYNWFSKEINGLKQDWHTANMYKERSSVWCNPPYGREIGDWIKKAKLEYKKWGNKSGYSIVMLLPARTDTKWFHEYIYNKPNVEIRFLRGRLKFGGSKNSAPFPSMICIFK